MATLPITTDALIIRTSVIPAVIKLNGSPATFLPVHVPNKRYLTFTLSQAKKPLYYLAIKATANSFPFSKKLAFITITVIKTIQLLYTARPIGDSQVTSLYGLGGIKE